MEKMIAMQNSSELVGTTEACQILGVNDSTISRWSDDRLRDEERRLTAVMRLGKRGAKLFRRADVEALKAQIDAERAEASA